jgi:hypothetical protein
LRTFFYGFQRGPRAEDLQVWEDFGKHKGIDV